MTRRPYSVYGGGGRRSRDLSIPFRHAALLLFVALVSYLNCLGCGFVFDDVSAIKENRDLRASSPISNVFLHDFWGTPMSKEQSHKSYRPITVLTFRLNYLMHVLEPMGYHLANLCLHLVVCLLYHKLCLAFVSRSVAQIASLLFAVHPVHTEAVTGVVGRAELISSIFFIMAVISYRRAALFSSWWSMISFVPYVALATFSKEQGITVLGVCFVFEVFVVQQVNIADVFKWLTGGGNNNLHLSQHHQLGTKKSAAAWCISHYLPAPVARTLVLVATGVILLLLRFRVMGSTLPVFTSFDNPASYEEAPVKQFTWSYLIAVNAALLLAPSELCCDWTMGTIPLVKSLADPRNLATIFTFVVLFNLGLAALFGRSRRHRVALVGSLSLLSLPFLPASNLFFPVGFVIAERVLYLPSMGACLLVAYGFSLLLKHFPSRKKLLRAVFVSLLTVHCAKTFVRNMDWRDEFSIFRAGLRVNSGNAKLFNNVGHALESESKYEEALNYFRRAVSVQPDDVGAHINVGRTYVNLEMPTEAEAAYMDAKALLPQARPGKRYTARVAPQHLSVFLNLANLISKDPSRLGEADTLYQQAISMRSDYVQAYINRGDVLLKMNRSEDAQDVYERALTFDENNPDLYYNLGVVHIERGHPEQALAHFDRALELDPDHVQALMNSAILMQETGRPELRETAYERLFKVRDRLPDNDRVYFNLGMLGMDDGDYESAEGWFKHAIHLKPDFRSALFNLALLLNEQKRPLEAIPHLKALLRFFPDHVKGLVLLGDINTNHVRDYAAAEECYRRIIEVDPGHVQARHNLCVVTVEKGRLDEAEDCLLKVRAMAPGLEYVERHLEIVRNRIKLAKDKAAAATHQEGEETGET